MSISGQPSCSKNTEMSLVPMSTDCVPLSTDNTQTDSDSLTSEDAMATSSMVGVTTTIVQFATDEELPWPDRNWMNGLSQSLISPSNQFYRPIQRENTLFQTTERHVKNPDPAQVPQPDLLPVLNVIMAMTILDNTLIVGSFAGEVHFYDLQTFKLKRTMIVDSINAIEYIITNLKKNTFQVVTRFRIIECDSNNYSIIHSYYHMFPIISVIYGTSPAYVIDENKDVFELDLTDTGIVVRGLCTLPSEITYGDELRMFSRKSGGVYRLGLLKHKLMVGIFDFTKLSSGVK